VLIAACDPRLDQRLAIIDQPRVLAIATEPAEAKPGAVVTYRALVADPAGPLDATPQWSFCIAPKPPTEDNAVSTGCLDSANLIELGSALELTATLPSDGCLRFGPDTPPGEFRPRAPDGTGGYYQPMRADVDALVAFGMSRITCKLPTAPGEIAREYDLRYVANRNPTFEPIALAAVAADSDVTLTASWPADAVEHYLYYDPLAQDLIERREAMRVSWFATAGTLVVDASDVAETAVATSVSTTWHAPAAGEAWLWFVLRDSRGGIAWQALHLTVE
jgi:hypothetical protein